MRLALGRPGVNVHSLPGKKVPLCRARVDDPPNESIQASELE